MINLGFGETVQIEGREQSENQRETLQVKSTDELNHPNTI